MHVPFLCLRALLETEGMKITPVLEKGWCRAKEGHSRLYKPFANGPLLPKCKVCNPSWRLPLTPLVTDLPGHSGGVWRVGRNGPSKEEGEGHCRRLIACAIPHGWRGMGHRGQELPSQPRQPPHRTSLPPARRESRLAEKTEANGTQGLLGCLWILIILTSPPHRSPKH